MRANGESDGEMGAARTTVRVSIDSGDAPLRVFEAFVEELAGAIAQQGMSFEAGMGGSIMQGKCEVGRIISWQPGELIRLTWHQADWNAEEVTEVQARFEMMADGNGTRVTLEHRGWGGLFGGSAEVLGWFAGEVAAPFLRATAPIDVGNWLTDRQARRPSGTQARAVYRAPIYHYPNFKAILAELALTPDDYLIEVGCGGGAFLKDALTSGCRAAAIDHSPDMVRLASEENHDAVAQGRLDIHQASADHLPFPDAAFTCAVMTGVLGFLPDPIAAFRELRRVLISEGRLVVLGSDPAMRGTPAAPEPMASRLRFYEDDELRQLALDAGFGDVQVVRRDLEPFARESGVPEEDLFLFRGSDTPFLLAR